MKNGAILSIIFLFSIIGSVGCMSLGEQVPTEDDKLLMGHILDESDNLGYTTLIMSAVNAEEYDLASEYADKAKYGTDQRVSAVNELGVSPDFQPIKTTFLEYLNLKNDMIYNFRMTAEYMKKDDLVKSLEYMKNATGDMSKMELRLKELNLQLEEVLDKYSES